MAEPADGPRLVRYAGILSRRILRCRGRDRAAASAILGLELPQTAYGSISSGGLHLLWLGPDEWLILNDSPTKTPLSEAAEALAKLGAAFVDVSDRQVGLLVEDPDSETLLASGCPLDLAPNAFPVGACARTLYHKAEVVLWRTGRTDFHLEVWRSLAPYVETLLTEAGRDERVATGGRNR